MIKNILSKLTFDKIADNTTLSGVYNDDNKYTNLTWTASNSPKISHSNNVKVLNITNNIMRIYSNNFTTHNSFKIVDFELDINISFDTLNSNNTFFGLSNGNLNWISFNVKNKLLGGFSISNTSGKTLQFNYEFETGKDYNIIVSSIDGNYRLIINGEIVGYIDSVIFTQSLSNNTNIMAVVGSGNIKNNDTNNLTNGKIWNVNISYGVGVKNENASSLMKYGSNLLSRLNFDNTLSSSSENVFVPDLEVLLNSKVNWEYDNSKLTDYYVNTTFKTNITNDFTLLFKMNNTVKNVDTNLIEYGDYKVIYNYVGLPEPEVIVNDNTTSALLDEAASRFEESFTLSNGTDSQTIINDVKKDSHNIRFIKDSDKTKLIVDSEYVEVPNVENTTDDLILFDNYNGKVSDIKLYDIPFEDEDIFLGNEPIDTVFGEIEYDDNEIELFIPEGDYNLVGFIEGYIDRPFYIYNKFYNYEVYNGISDYNISHLDKYNLDDYEINDLISGNKYPVLKHEMIKGFISGTVNLKNCGVTFDNMEVFCYRSDNYRYIGTYSVDKDGKYVIPNLDVNSRYDIIFRDKTKKIKDQISNYRQPMKY